jgi:hypothetical protein
MHPVWGCWYPRIYDFDGDSAEPIPVQHRRPVGDRDGTSPKRPSLTRSQGRYATGPIPVNSEQVGVPDGTLARRVCTACTRIGRAICIFSQGNEGAERPSEPYYLDLATSGSGTDRANSGPIPDQQDRTGMPIPPSPTYPDQLLNPRRRAVPTSICRWEETSSLHQHYSILCYIYYCFIYTMLLM